MVGTNDLFENSRPITVAIGTLKFVSDSKVLVADGDYSANDVLSESKTVGTCFTFAHAARANGGSGYITKIRAAYKKATGLTVISSRVGLLLFTKAPTSVLNDNAGNTGPILADEDNYIGMIELGGFKNYGSTTVCHAKKVPDGIDLPMAFECDAADDSLYGIAVFLDAEANETAGATLKFKLGIDQN
jgi:hypothetical protein